MEPIRLTIAPLILASSSPRRRELLREAGYAFEVSPPHPEAETPGLPHEGPVALVRRLAHEKAADVARRTPRGLVLGCDTVASIDGEILGKPADRDDARRMLTLLQGRVHHVHSGLCLWPVPIDASQTQPPVAESPTVEPIVSSALTELHMAPLSSEAIDEYLDSGLWQGKAGAFGYQDRLGWLDLVSGSESNVVGLPLELLAELLHPWRL